MIINRNAYFALERAFYSQVHERVPSQTLVLLSMRIGLASAIVIATAIILLTSNITIINAQQFTDQPGEITQNGTTTAAATTLFESRNDSFRVQVPQGWVIDDVNNTGSTLESELTQGYGILAELCPEEEEGEQQQQEVLSNVSSSSNSNSSSICQQQQQQAQDEIIHILRYPNLGTRLGITLDEIRNITMPASVLEYQIQKLREVGYRDINVVNSTDTTISLHYNTTEGVPFPEAIVPARVVEMTYSTSSAPSEMKTGYIILTATNVTPPNLQAITGYGIFYEGASGATAATATEDTTTPSGNLLLPFMQVFNSFELIISEEAAQAILGSITQQAAGDEPTDQEEGGDGGDTPTPPSQ